MSISQFPAYVVDEGAGAGYTIFTIGAYHRVDVRKRAMDYAKKYLRPRQISHRIYAVESQEDFDAIIRRRNP